jgi:F-type H+-transporting ATPase subunit c
MEEMAYFAKAAAYIGAAFAIGIGTIGPAMGQGSVGARACENIGKYPESADAIKSAMFYALVAIETSSVYALLIAGGLVFFGSRS